MAAHIRWYTIAGLVLILGGGWLWISRPPLDAAAFDEPRPAIAHPAPDFSLARYGTNPAIDETFTLSDWQGTPVVLNFWATWCGPCRREFPALEAASQQFAGDVLILGVDQGESAATVERFLAEIGAEIPIVLDGDMDVGQMYNVSGLPTTFFIDRNGVIRNVWAGEMNGAILTENIVEILR